MEALTRMVADSLARYGMDRPVDPRRLQWSRWFRCDSAHSLLVVPSKPGIFAFSEEVMDLCPGNPHIGTATPVPSKIHVGTAAFGCPAEQSSAAASAEPRRLLAVLQFSEDDDMAFTLDRMFARNNPMRERLASGRCFLRFVVIEDQSQRRSICAALNQWMLSSAEKATGLTPDFSSSLEFVGRADVARTCPERQPEGPSPATAGATVNSAESSGPEANVVNIDSGSARNLHCPQPLPSGF